MVHIPENPLSAKPVLVGIFVGGRASRMGGIAKGLLAAPDGVPIVTRVRLVFEESLADARAVLVGKHAAYESLGLPMLADDPRADGPLAGILALLAYAEAQGIEHAFAIACDMPIISRELVRRLSSESRDAIIHAPKREGYWEPFFARYNVASMLPIARSFADAGGRKLQRLLDPHATRLPLSDDEARTLADWDTEDDVTRAACKRREKGEG